jgi:hypothetical protein
MRRYTRRLQRMTEPDDSKGQREHESAHDSTHIREYPSAAVQARLKWDRDRGRRQSLADRDRKRGRPLAIAQDLLGRLIDLWREIVSQAMDAWRPIVQEHRAEKGAEEQLRLRIAEERRVEQSRRDKEALARYHEEKLKREEAEKEQRERETRRLQLAGITTRKHYQAPVDLEQIRAGRFGLCPRCNRRIALVNARDYTDWDDDRMPAIVYLCPHCPGEERLLGADGYGIADIIHREPVGELHPWHDPENTRDHWASIRPQHLRPGRVLSGAVDPWECLCCGTKTRPEDGFKRIGWKKVYFICRLLDGPRLDPRVGHWYCERCAREKLRCASCEREMPFDDASSLVGWVRNDINLWDDMKADAWYCPEDSALLRDRIIEAGGLNSRD